MSLMGLAESTHEEERRATHVAISIVSPGKEEDEEKNQDRLILMETTDSKNTKSQFAIVCDGTSTSPYSAVAAEYVSGQVHALFQEDGIQRTTETLQEMRLALLEKPLKIDEGQSAFLRTMFEEIVRQKYQNSYQTTFVAVCLKRDETNSERMVSIKAIGCGDSALFIFQQSGDILYNNINLADELDRFKHSSPLTAVLPDCYDADTKNVLFDFEEFPEDVHLLLCSDGFYDGFTNFREIREWLNEHYSELKNSELHLGCLSELHNNLDQKKGDDDISFIWLHPAKNPEVMKVVEDVGKEEQPDGQNSDGGKSGFFARLLETILRFCRVRIL